MDIKDENSKSLQVRGLVNITDILVYEHQRHSKARYGDWLTWFDAVNPVNLAVPKGMTTLAAVMTAGTRIGTGTGKVGIVTGLALTMG